MTATRLPATGQAACCQILIGALQRCASRSPDSDWFPTGRRLASEKLLRERGVKVWPPSCRAAGVTGQQRPDGVQQQQDEVVAFVLKGKIVIMTYC